MVDFFSKIASIVGHDLVRVAADGTIADNDSYVDTGCYTLNIALSGSLFGGAPSNKVVGFASKEAVGKSYLIMQVIKKFLNENPTGRVVYNDTEGRIDKAMLEKRGIDLTRVQMAWPETIEQFKNLNYKIIDSYKNLTKKEKFPFLMVADSLGQLPSEKQINDTNADKTAGDQGLRAKCWKATWNVLRQPLAKAKIPMFCTNHTYQGTGLFPTTEMAGGSGFKYSSDIILMLAKKRDTDKDKVVQGNVINMKVDKGWNVKQHSEFRCYLSYSTGLNKHFGLQDIALQAEILKMDDAKYVLPDGNKITEKELLTKPEKYYTKDILDQIEKFVKDRYCFSTQVELEDIGDIAEKD